MSLLIPTRQDHFDAHGHLDDDVKYIELLTQSKQTHPEHYQWDFQPIKGFFKQTEPDTDDMTFRYTQDHFGILKPWPEIISHLNHLNKTAGSNERYILFFLARHGEGWHNIAMRKYSRHEWHLKWSRLNSDDEISWGPDADLTELGIEQAWENHRAWKTQLMNGAPWPSRFYVSPLTRSIRTHNITWKDTDVEILEGVRETIGLHPCNRRSQRSVIRDRFPNVVFPSEFQEVDEWFEEYRETRECLHEQTIRINRVLQELFENDNGGEIVCITSHTGTIRSFLSVIGHRKFVIPTGGMIPVVVKGTKTTL